MISTCECCNYPSRKRDEMPGDIHQCDWCYHHFKTSVIQIHLMEDLTYMCDECKKEGLL